MNKRKLNLDELKVESFITSFEEDTARTVQGGIKLVLEPRPRTYGCPTENVGRCPADKSEGCFSEAAGNCTEIMFG
ncbi:MAG: pinensin family lanthipeptide [Cyclobacteriaceae bacterium]